MKQEKASIEKEQRTRKVLEETRVTELAIELQKVRGKKKNLKAVMWSKSKDFKRSIETENITENLSFNVCVVLSHCGFSLYLPDD